MQIIADARKPDRTFPNLVLTIGSFDGIHLGHHKIVDELMACARATGGTAGLMTLQPHPRQFFSPESAPNILTPLRKKEQILNDLGLDVLYILPFTAQVAALTAQQFVEQILVESCQTKTVVVGHDFAFGKGAQGNYDFLCEIAPSYGFDVHQVPALILQGERVGSTAIRERIIQGELENIEALLGRRYSILGEVVRGRGIGGSRLGYPTANVKPHNCAVPAHGVYVGEVLLDGVAHRAAVNIGIAPTILQEDVTIEAFILDFEENIVGREIEVVFHKRLRPEKKFNSLEELVHAIAVDVDDVRKYFAVHPRAV